MNWNPVLNFVRKVKKEYVKVFGTISYDCKTGYTDESESCLERWILELAANNPDNEIYQVWVKMIEPLEINQHNSLVLLRYGRYSNIYDGEEEASGEGFWDLYDGFYRECRSVVINVEAEELVITPYKKFFNINELPETDIQIVRNNISKAKTIEFSNKLDGSMQCARWYKDELIMSGSQAINPDNSWRLQDGIRMFHDNSNYLLLAKTYPELTFIFEYISVKDAHVVKYDKSQEGLYLIGIRNTVNGETADYESVIKVANFFNIPTTEVFNKTLEQVMSELDSVSSDKAEGFVINVDDERYKIKYNDYVHIHRALSKLSSVNLIIRSIADGTFDDMISKLPKAYHEDVFKISKIVENYIQEENSKISDYYNQVKHLTDKKEYMIAVNTLVPKAYRGYLTNIYNGKENNVLKSGKKYKKLRQMLSMEYKDNYGGIL